MTTVLSNAFRGQGLACYDPQGQAVWPASDAGAVAQLLSHCPAHGQTPLRDMAQLAKEIGIGALWVKDERGRMGLGSFKALGAAFAIARAALEARAHTAPPTPTDWANALQGRVFVTASAGNHGLSVAAGAHIFGAKAVIYLAETVPAAFAERLNAKGAQVVRAGATYEDSMQAAAEAATHNGWTLLSDSSWPGYCDLPHQVMEGYLQLAAEAATQVPTPPHTYPAASRRWRVGGSGCRPCPRSLGGCATDYRCRTRGRTCLAGKHTRRGIGHHIWPRVRNGSVRLQNPIHDCTGRAVARCRRLHDDIGTRGGKRCGLTGPTRADHNPLRRRRAGRAFDGALIRL